MAAIVGWLIPRSGWGAFFGGFCGGFLCWLLAAWMHDNANNSMLSTKVGQLFLGVEPTTLLLVTALLGGLLAAFGALTGRWARELLIKPSGKRSYMQEKRRR
jgi:hypothetical protein